MFIRNLLSTGQQVIPLPYGLPIKLEYNKRGEIHRVYLISSDGDTSLNLTDDLLQGILKIDSIPRSITIMGSTTYIYGVLVNSDLIPTIAKNITDYGYLWELATTSIIESLMKSSKGFEFYAGNLHNVSSIQCDFPTVRTSLKREQFKLLPSLLVTANTKEVDITNAIMSLLPKASAKMLIGFMVFDIKGVTYIDARLMLEQTIKVTKKVDTYGNILADVCFDEHEITLPWSKVVKYDIQKGNYVLLDTLYFRILKTFSDNRNPVSERLVCDECKSIINVDVNKSHITCSNPNCISTQYAVITEILSKLHLPIISKEVLISSSRFNPSNANILDVLKLPEYKSVLLELSLFEALRAIIPNEVLPQAISIHELVESCNSSVDSLCFYLSEKGRMVGDFNLDTNVYRRFLIWLTEDKIKLIDDFLHMTPQIKIVDKLSKLANIPMLRKYNILVTGKFVRGSIEDIINILSSYSANCNRSLTDTANMVLVGDLMEDIDGDIIKYANSHRIPIYAETQFFKQFEIDSDLEKVL